MQPYPSLLYYDLEEWYIEHSIKIKRFPTRLMIRRRAKKLNQKKKFKASNSWIDKFMRITDVKETVREKFEELGINQRAVKKQRDYKHK